MRRIYESDALVADDDPHTPTGRDRDRPRAIDWGAASHALMPTGLRDRALEVSVTTDRRVVRAGSPLTVRVKFRNRLPVPVRLVTDSPVRWRWAVDGVPAASELATAGPPDRRSTLDFARRERKTVTRTWRGAIRGRDGEWTPVDPGEHTIAAWVNVPDAADRGLRDETTIRIA